MSDHEIASIRPIGEGLMLFRTTTYNAMLDVDSRLFNDGESLPYVMTLVQAENWFGVYDVNHVEFPDLYRALFNEEPPPGVLLSELLSQPYTR